MEKQSNSETQPETRREVRAWCPALGGRGPVGVCAGGLLITLTLYVPSRQKLGKANAH